MGFAFGHLAGSWGAGKIYEYIAKSKISHYAWFFLLLGGILPDADFLLDWTLGTDIHRTVTHSLFFLVLAPLIVYVLFSILKNSGKKEFALSLGLGIAIHLFLDGFSGYGIPLLWPGDWYFSFFSGMKSGVPDGGLLAGGAEELLYKLKLAILDMGIGAAWIFYLWFRKRIQF